VRLDQPARPGRTVGEAHPLAGRDGGGEDGQLLRLDQRPLLPGRRRGRRGERAEAPAQPGRQDLLELAERPQRRLRDAGDRLAGGGPQAEHNRDRLVVVEQQRRQRGAGNQPVAALRAQRRLDRVAQLA
jgi:hypothetical protein